MLRLGLRRRRRMQFLVFVDIIDLFQKSFALQRMNAFSAESKMNDKNKKANFGAVSVGAVMAWSTNYIKIDVSWSKQFFPIFCKQGFWPIVILLFYFFYPFRLARLSSDTDIRNIVDQWKQSDLGTENKEQKYVDTRTFTRPKKKLYSHSDANNGFGASRNRLSSGSDALVRFPFLVICFNEIN